MLVNANTSLNKYWFAEGVRGAGRLLLAQKACAMLHFNEGSWGSIMRTVWYFPRVSLERGLIVYTAEEKSSERTWFPPPPNLQALQDHLIAHE